MSRENNLPFPRGETMWNGDSAQISATGYSWLEGKTYKVEDDQHGTGAMVTLRVVRQKNATRAIGSRGIRYGTTTGWLGRKSRGYAADKTAVNQAVDDKYFGVTTIAQNDLFYVVDSGPVKCLVGSLATGSTALTNGNVVAFGHGGGLLDKVTNATANQRPYGTLQEAVTTGTTGNRRALVWAGGLFADKV